MWVDIIFVVSKIICLDLEENIFYLSHAIINKNDLILRINHYVTLIDISIKINHKFKM